MKKLSIFFAATILASAASCSKIDIQEGPMEPQRELTPLAIFSGDKVEAKTSLNGSAVYWTADDVVAVFDKGNFKNEFKAVSVDGSKARFEGLVEAGTTEFYAVYPYQRAVSADNSNLYLQIPADQTPEEGTFAEELNLSVAKGARTPGQDEVAGLKFRNVCGVLYFTVPERLAAVSNVKFVASNRMLSGDVTVSKSDAPAITKVTSGSNYVSMSGSFQAGSTFYFVVAPGDIAGFSVEVTTANGATFSKTSTKTISVDAGAFRNLGTIDFKSEPSAVAEHTLENGILTGTEVTFNLGLPSKMEQYVENVKVSMYNPNTDEEVRNLTWDNPGTSSVMAVVGDNKYLPQGDYTVRCTYTVNGIEEVKTFVAEVPEPVFRPTASAYTSYNLYCLNDSNANSCHPETIYDIKYSVNISEEILAKYPMNSCSGCVYDSNGSAIFPISSTSDSSIPLNKPEFYTKDEVVVTNWGEYNLSAVVTFDNVTIEGEPCIVHITGLPYDVSFVNNTTPSGWAFSNTAVNDNRICLKVTESSALSPTFHIPGNIKVVSCMNAYAYSGSVFVGWKMYLKTYASNTMVNSGTQYTFNNSLTYASEATFYDAKAEVELNTSTKRVSYYMTGSRPTLTVTTGGRSVGIVCDHHWIDYNIPD